MTITAPQRPDPFDSIEIMHLRRWGQEQQYPLSEQREHVLTIGSSDDCSIRIEHPYVSRHHAQLRYDGIRWQLKDTSKNGIFVDGVRFTDGSLEAGMEIDFGGGAVLVTESPKLVELRRFLSRLLGWGDSQRKQVETAMRELRLATIRGKALIVRGKGDMVPITRRLHEYLHPAPAPFIVCDPKRSQGSESLVRSPWNIGDVRGALAAARNGTLCLRYERLPEDSDALLSVAPEERISQRVQIVICADGRSELFLANTITIAVPPLSERSDQELAQIIAEYAEDARRDLETSCQLSSEDLRWVQEEASDSLDEIGKATLRLLALRCTGTVLGAADRLGMSAVSVRRWMERRNPPPIPGAETRNGRPRKGKLEK